MTTVNEIQIDSTDLGEIPPDHSMTVEEFEKWAFAQELATYEWVEGKIIMMAPVSDWHNDLNRWLIMLIGQYLETLDLGIIRYDMFFRMPDRRRVPDLFVLKNENIARLKPNALDGPADVVFEIISPDSGARDWRDKYLEYEAAGVGEYWVIDPTMHVVECYSLGEDRRFDRVAAKGDQIASAVLDGFYLRPSWLWQKPLPKVVGLLREMGVIL